jgi:Fe-S-cluster containining protein
MRYLPLLEKLDQWQADAREAHPGIIPCRSGCSACCRGPFDISVADALVVIGGIDRLSEPVRAQVAERARDAVDRMRRVVPEWTAPYAVHSIGEEAFDRVSDALADLPCPLLDAEGRCLVYAERPMVCRMIGVGMVTESDLVIENACPIQEQFPAYAALEPIGFPLESTETEEDLARLAAARQLFGDPAMADFETTVAGAVLLTRTARDPNR